jgi:hypothetical protein
MASSSRAKNTASQGTIIDLFDDLGMSHTKFTTTYADGGRLAALKKYEQFFVQLLELTQRPTKAVLKAAAVKSCRVSPHSAEEFAQKILNCVKMVRESKRNAKTLTKTDPVVVKLRRLLGSNDNLDVTLPMVTVSSPSPSRKMKLWQGAHSVRKATCVQKVTKAERDISNIAALYGMSPNKRTIPGKSNNLDF